jgi:hypothetical protein
MKKYFLSFAITLLAFFAKSQNVTTENGMIKFNSIANYTYYADDSVNKLALKSFSENSTVNTLSKQSQPIDDETIPLFLQQLLNTDNMMVIGNYLVKFDFTNNRALIMNKNTSGALTALQNNNINQAGVIVLGFDDGYEGVEIFEGLETGTITESNYTSFISPAAVEGRCKMADKKKDEHQWIWSTLKMHEHFLDGSNYDYQAKYKYDYKLVYQGFIFYFQIFAKSKCRTSMDNVFTHEIKKDMRIAGKLKYDIRCREEQTASHDFTEFTGVRDWVPYSGSRSLNKYDFTVDFQTKHAWESTYGHSIPLRIVHGY